MYFNYETIFQPELIEQPPDYFKSFLMSEIASRKTRLGKVPDDWDMRRQYVYYRDDACCQRCGIVLPVYKCHIHHIIKKSISGDHSLNNLVTLCKDCHSLMDGHEIMHGFGSYAVSRTGIIHAYYCRHAKQLPKRAAYLPTLIKTGKRPCKQCDPWAYHNKKISSWQPEFNNVVTGKMYSILNNVKNRYQL